MDGGLKVGRLVHRSRVGRISRAARVTAPAYFLFVARYDVSFDGKCQEKFRDAPSAVAWASEVGATGRTVYVVGRGWLRPTLVAVFPAEEVERGSEDFKRKSVFWGGGNGVGF